jgi:hypothetical protein
MLNLFRGLLCSLTLVLMSCTKTVESQLQEYLEFYYPTSGTFYYQIAFEWGDYLIDTGAAIDEDLHADSESYRGYITARPSMEETADGQILKTYLVTPDGEVWITTNRDIPEIKSREEIVTKETDYGTSTNTTTINSTLEPVVDHFRTNKSDWQKYGKLTSSNGKSTLELENN